MNQSERVLRDNGLWPLSEWPVHVRPSTLIVIFNKPNGKRGGLYQLIDRMSVVMVVNPELPVPESEALDVTMKFHFIVFPQDFAIERYPGWVEAINRDFLHPPEPPRVPGSAVTDGPRWCRRLPSPMEVEAHDGDWTFQENGKADDRICMRLALHNGKVATSFDNTEVATFFHAGVEVAPVSPNGEWVEWPSAHAES